MPRLWLSFKSIKHFYVWKIWNEMKNRILQLNFYAMPGYLNSTKTFVYGFFSHHPFPFLSMFSRFGKGTMWKSLFCGVLSAKLEGNSFSMFCIDFHSPGEKMNYFLYIEQNQFGKSFFSSLNIHTIHTFIIILITFSVCQCGICLCQSKREWVGCLYNLNMFNGFWTAFTRYVK